MSENNYLVALGERISQKRKEKRFTQERLAESIGVSLQTISNIECGRKAARPENCLVIEDADAGVAAAKSGGMYALAVGAAKDNPYADYSAESLEDFKSVLDMIF